MEAADALDFNLVDECKQYCAAPIINIDDAIAWWLEPTQQKTFPNLSKMHLDYLSIPAMSAEPERLFSSAKVTISDRRSRLGSDVIEALECLRSWLQIQDTEADLIVDIKTDIKREQQAREKEELEKVEEAMIREDNS
jgi:hypothetical protein